LARGPAILFRGVEPRHEDPEDEVEHESQSADTSSVSRGQNQLHVLPEDWSAGGGVIEPLLERLEASEAATQLLVVTNDSEAAAGLAAHLAIVADRTLRLLAATDARRASRVQRIAPAHVVTGAPEVLAELVRSTVLKVDGIRVVVLAWVDDLGSAATRALETLMAELPKESMRMVLASAVTPAVEQLVERYARRARRPQPFAAESAPPVSLSYVVTNASAKLVTLRAVLDAVDPDSAIVVARTVDSKAVVESSLRALGYGGDASAVRVEATPSGDAALVVLYDLPSSEDEVRAVVRASGSARVIAVVGARQVSALRRLAGGAVTPFTLPAAAERARTREARMRDELREVLHADQYARELQALEPLLAQYDGAEVAAAALRLLDAERSKPRVAPEPVRAAMTRLYVNVGEMDKVRPGDLVGAFTNEAGISRSELGRVEVRERHSTVEVATGVADAVVAKLNGVSIKGRRAMVKVDEERERRDRPARPPRERSPRRTGRDHR
jgi:ATP-dependent RNA helicase DeaD